MSRGNLRVKSLLFQNSVYILYGTVRFENEVHPISLKLYEKVESTTKNNLVISTEVTFGHFGRFFVILVIFFQKVVYLTFFKPPKSFHPNE